MNWCNLIDYDKDGEKKVFAAALYRFGEMSLCRSFGLCQNLERS